MLLYRLLWQADVTLTKSDKCYYHFFPPTQTQPHNTHQMTGKTKNYLCQFNTTKHSISFTHYESFRQRTHTHTYTQALTQKQGQGPSDAPKDD